MAREGVESMQLSSGNAGRAVLVAVQLPQVSDEDHEADLAELERLVRTLGYETVARVTQKRPALDAATVVGGGKLKELADWTGGKGVVPAYARTPVSKARARFEAAEGEPPGDDAESEQSDGESPTLVVVDHELTPTQARNLEKATGASVLDRTGVIVDIFHRHAKTREARLQVELARLAYVAPRMRESADTERRAGRGAGASALELDRRKIRDRMAALREELKTIESRDQGRRKSRQGQPRVALVGYTNAGKSSLMRALTGSEVLVEDKLFATLDTTVRALKPETKPRIVVSDTVGFIKKLPHDLVASFRSTLEEANEASLLLFVVDASDPAHEQQLEVTKQVLAETGAGDIPSRLVFNKCDRVEAGAREELAAAHPDALFVSARDAADVERLRQAIVDFFEAGMRDESFVVPHAKLRFLADAHAEGRVLSEQYEEDGAHLVVRALPEGLARLRRALSE